MASFEPLVDEVLHCFDEKVRPRTSRGAEPFDLGKWLQFFAFDSVGTMTFSRKYGFLDSGCDADGILESVQDFMRASAPVSPVIQLSSQRRRSDLQPDDPIAVVRSTLAEERRR